MKITIDLWDNISLDKLAHILRDVQVALVPYMEPDRGPKGVLLAELDLELRKRQPEESQDETHNNGM